MRTAPCFAGGLATWCAWLGFKVNMGKPNLLNLTDEQYQAEQAKHRKQMRDRKKAQAIAKKLGLKIMSRNEAISAGLNKYFSGKPCPKGHFAERYVNPTCCVQCSSEYTKKYRAEKPHVYLSYMAKYTMKRRRTDVEYAARIRARSVISNALARFGYRKDSKAQQIIGCSWDEFMRHMERQFLPGMTWENRGRWHIDHIVPMASAKDHAEALALNHFTNLRPIWGADNIAKSDKSLFLI